MNNQRQADIEKLVKDENVKHIQLWFTDILGNLKMVEVPDRQLAARAEIPLAYTTTLAERGDWGRELLAENFNRIFSKIESQRVLTRAVNGEIRGVLSDSYRRLDSRPIIESFALACAKVGAVPVEGIAGDLRLSIRALLPHVFKTATEVFAFGIAFSLAMLLYLSVRLSRLGTEKDTMVRELALLRYEFEAERRAMAERNGA